MIRFHQIFAGLTVLIALSSRGEAGGKLTAPAESPVLPVVLPSPFYIGIGGLESFIRRDPCPCASSETKTQDHRYGAILRVGFDFNKYVGVEGRIYQTFGDKIFSQLTHYGLYLKPQIPLTQKLSLYGLVGYGKTTVDYTNGIRSSRTTKSGFAYGAGITYDLSTDEGSDSRWSLWADFQHLLTDDGPVHTDANTAAAGILYHF